LAEGLERLRSSQHGEPYAELALAQLYYAQVQLDLGEYASARQALQDSLSLHRTVGDVHGMALALAYLAGADFAVGDFSAAQTVCAESLVLRRNGGDAYGLAFTLSQAGAIAIALGEYDQAQAWLDEGTRLVDSLGHAGSTAAVQRIQGWLAVARGDLESARRCFEGTLVFSQETGNRKEMALDLLCLADLAAKRGQPEEAQQLHEQCLDLFHDIGYRRGAAEALIGLGQVKAGGADGARVVAEGHLAEALRIALEIGSLPSALAALVGYGSIWAEGGRRLAAAELLTFVLYHPASSRRTQIDAGRVLSRLEAELPPADIAGAEERGRRAEFAHVVSLAQSAHGLAGEVEHSPDKLTA
jgi:tetratricopeptide (TPR) repeat protein